MRLAEYPDQNGGRSDLIPALHVDLIEQKQSHTTPNRLLDPNDDDR